MEGKTILAWLGGAAVVSTLFAFKKKNEFSKVIENMTMDLRNLRNLRLRDFGTPQARVLLDLDIAFHNPTKFDMTIYSAGLITVKQIQLLYKGVLIGNALPKGEGENKFELPAYSNYVIEGITVQLSLVNVVQQFLTGGLDTNVNNYQIHTVVDALGKSWIVKQ
ncbi:hypothetical protein [Flavobacterium commune]|uniref:Late embryogenesis abundant protein LEA-2 subgroup domain-containing protein n=1 Tax=Flavobacterium commune TaxID=1306519 RepID=A0A1D9PAJ0_9FLAO|nr:hypothetical protein [Flavobacterium commune]AOZ99586.1 hypothetical protein BIW12_09115 [Flavobacterium commune]